MAVKYSDSQVFQLLVSFSTIIITLFYSIHGYELKYIRHHFIITYNLETNYIKETNSKVYLD